MNKQKYDLFYDVAPLVGWFVKGYGGSMRVLVVGCTWRVLALWEHHGRFYPSTLPHSNEGVPLRATLGPLPRCRQSKQARQSGQKKGRGWVNGHDPPPKREGTTMRLDDKQIALDIIHQGKPHKSVPGRRAESPINVGWKARRSSQARGQRWGMAPPRKENTQDQPDSKGKVGSERQDGRRGGNAAAQRWVTG